MRPNGMPFADGLLILLATWIGLYCWLVVVTALWLAPWTGGSGCCAPETIPPPGTAARAVNDFFATPPGQVLPASMVIVPSAMLFVLRARQPGASAGLALRFALLNSSFIVAHFFSIPLVYMLNNRLGPLTLAGVHPAYGWTVLPLLMTTAWLALLLVLQLGQTLPARTPRPRRPAQGAARSLDQLRARRKHTA